jgi:short-subunit dehydrogenase
MRSIPLLALVTGASSGIGQALCRLLADKGIDLLITGRQEERLNSLVEEFRENVSVIAFTADLALPEGRRRVVDKIHEYQPDLVVNNAGFGIYGQAIEHSIRGELEIAEVNALAVLELTLEAARTMIKGGKKGTILNVSSAAAFQVFPMLATYSAAKAFVNQLSESLDYETRGKGVRVLVACPGMVNTGFRSRASGEEAADADNPTVMSASFAAEQLWKQIVNQQGLSIFDWKTRLGTFFSRNILPKAFVAKLIARNIGKRIKQRSECRFLS